ncbi:PEP-CTERM/exosortase system-associated acyltransferase [Pseudomaricurvus alkylphenolicus]|uniref:PEP-CTERM/exosortase system-associated acyltransferase n=1 Tax=Pseudomaricurvus alkylphenolicus TaxID=1306991 RepID=UPI00141FB484|nr:PEP-CTERM/exosortase system-associated acyltransferase [Pseudomaricurvus alkylphenolicus]NIB43156.1 PEP-CTERM/exosortase system-associated acyltransferase [Pseudomaricurvus alkylphenolicus]
MTQTSLTETFHKYFQVELAHTAQQKQDVFGIRYRVYCDEFGYESKEQYPDQIEYDEYDPQAKHCLVTHKATGTPAGCVRIIPTYSTEVRDPLPFEKYCYNSLDEEFIESLEMPRDSMCEVSRLAVDGRFRKRTLEKSTRCGEMAYLNSDEDERRTFPLIAVSAYLACTAISNLTHRENTFMMTEPFFPKLLARSGVVAQRAGRDTEYHGIRAPYYITAGETAGSLKGDLKELYTSILEDFKGYGSALH